MGILPLAFSLDHAGPDGVDRRGLRDHAAGDGRPRPGRPGERQPCRSRITAPRCRAASRGCASALIRHFYERDNEANAATRQAIDAAAQEIRRARLLGARADAVAARRLGGLRRHDHAVRGLCDPRGQPARALHRLRRDLPRPHGAGRADHRRRLRPGVAPPPRAGRPSSTARWPISTW